ncbi:DUF4199 domain-containing protein [Postechiella marina]|uniref:DUF4199 domain-containing protein n=1 Tax=Postechiella marina TaxID=943941 RepID=A0ABP8CGT9_9FLAO
MEKTLKSIATNYGLYLGATLTLLILIGYGVNLDLFTQIWFGLLFLFLILAFGIVSVFKSKKLLGGYISFKDAFTAYFITILIGLTISSIISVVIFNFIDPDAAVDLQQRIIDSQVVRLENYNMPADAIAKVVDEMEKKGNMYSISNILQSLVWQLAGYSVVGLIVAAIMKKRNPDAE